jgi:hypothetical protein
MEELKQEVVGLLAQVIVFTVGMSVSLVIGMVLAARTDGPAALLVVTIVAGAGLLGAAVLSQVVRDRLVYGPDTDPPA